MLPRDPFDVQVTLESQAGTHGIIRYNNRRYFIEIGWLDAIDVDNNLYCINITYLTTQSLVLSKGSKYV